MTYRQEPIKWGFKRRQAQFPSGPSACLVPVCSSACCMLWHALWFMRRIDPLNTDMHWSSALLLQSQCSPWCHGHMWEGMIPKGFLVPPPPSPFPTVPLSDVPLLDYEYLFVFVWVCVAHFWFVRWLLASPRQPYLHPWFTGMLLCLCCFEWVPRCTYSCTVVHLGNLVN